MLDNVICDVKVVMPSFGRWAPLKTKIIFKDIQVNRDLTFKIRRFESEPKGGRLHSKLHIITLVATKVHMILRSFVVLTWMHNTIEFV